ncbi:ornithine carbamoyltransferase [Malassezia sp. CBS 17886]|nr:ornithine carbamoyltransferase [Malassezia sp. CBS 17886]
MLASTVCAWRAAAFSTCADATRARVPSLLTLGQLSVAELDALLQRSAHFKAAAKRGRAGDVRKSLQDKNIAVMFSKRSTRTRVASETSATALGGYPLFLGPSDIQLGVNESLYDTARVLSSMVDGIMARVGAHGEIETLAENSSVPVINALSSRFHPTQILADLLTLLELEAEPGAPLPPVSSLAGRKVAWVGDANNILNDMLVSYPRLGMDVSIAAPAGAAYERDPHVWDMMLRGLAAQPAHLPKGRVDWAHEPRAAVADADYIVTDTWVSMGDEGSKVQRLRDFAGFQVTEELGRDGTAKADWKFLHCLPRKAEEVDDDVFYGPRSVVFQEAENRKWTIMACFDWLFGGRAL